MVSVLCLCVHNSTRSQIAEAYFRRFDGDILEVESAGLEPGVLNPLAVRALAEDGIDISGKQTQDVFDLYRAGRSYRYVITVCSRDAAERCPIFPGRSERLHWPFPDPSTFTGSDDEKMAKVRDRDLTRSPDLTIFKTMKETMINITEAKAKMSEISRRVKNGERFILSDRNRPFAEIRPLPVARRPFGLARGTVRLPKNFNAPDRDIERLFEGRRR